jgi:hypothetical protein
MLVPWPVGRNYILEVNVSILKRIAKPGRILTGLWVLGSLLMGFKASGQEKAAPLL